MGVVAVLVVVAGAVYQRKRSQVKPLAPIRGGRTTKWNFIAIFSITLSITVASNLVTINGVDSPYLLGALIYLWLAAVPAYCWRRHSLEMGG